MTRSEMIKMLGNAASALKGLPKGNVEHMDGQAPNAQLKVDVLQLILQILQALLAQQGQAGTAETAADDADLFASSNSILESIKIDQFGAASHSTPDVRVAGLQIDILQLILQIIAAILAPQNPTPAKPAAETAALDNSTGVHAAAIHPLLTSDSVTYTIDTLGRLTKLTYLSGTTITFNYDAVGNRTSVVTVL